MSKINNLVQNYPSRITLVKYLTVLKISVTRVFKTSHFVPARCSNQNRRTEKKEVFETNLKIDFLRARARQIVKIVIHIAAVRLKFHLHLVYLREVGLSLHSMLRTYLVQV